MERSETIYTYIEDLEDQDKAYNECCRQRREALDIFEQQEITMNEA
jgi:glutamyl/glutaminyl-tRNA synthetase